MQDPLTTIFTTDFNLASHSETSAGCRASDVHTLLHSLRTNSTFTVLIGPVSRPGHESDACRKLDGHILDDHIQPSSGAGKFQMLLFY